MLGKLTILVTSASTTATTVSTVPTVLIHTSPGTNYSRGAWSILSSGDSENTSSGYNIDLSYGQSYVIRVRFTARIISVLYMKGAIKYEIY